MSTIEERLQIRRVPIDKWSIREQLCLGSAVVRSGDQNWMSVSRALKPFAEPNRPPDWFSQKNCAAQYGSLLENVETPKRKKRLSGSETVVETPGESILKKLVQERKIELRKKMEEEKREYFKLQEQMELIRSGSATDAMIEEWSAQIDEEEKQKEQDATAHAQWLKQREERKLEVERAFRPASKVNPPVPGQKRKASDSLDTSITESSDETTPVQETSKPALSPLLTSLLKTPAHVPNVTSSILHSAITQRGTATSPTIASLLNTSASVPVSPSLQQLVSTAISQEPVSVPPASVPPLVSLTKPDISASILATTTFTTTNSSSATGTVKEEKEQSIKQIPAEELLLESSKISEKIAHVVETVMIKKEEIKQEVEEIIAIKCEDTTDKKEIIPAPDTAKVEIKSEVHADTIIEETVQHLEDIYDFDNNSKTSSEETVLKDSSIEAINDTDTTTNDEQSKQGDAESIITEIQKDVLIPADIPLEGKDVQPGSVEIVEIVVMEDEDSDKEMNKKVSEIKRDIIRHKKEKDAESETIYSQKEVKLEEKPAQKETTVYDEYDFDDIKKPDEKPEEKTQNDLSLDIDAPEFSRKSTFTPEFSETFYDDMSTEVNKQDKPGKAKRDYSRTRKKEEKDIEILLAVEKAVSASLEENEVLEETSSEKDSQDSDKKSDSSKHKLKDNTERSNSPWTEEEEVLPKTRRRLSATPATPSDSIPNSPASGTAIFDDDRDYRTWKKSVMLVYSRLSAHKCASLFLKPITDEQAPGYHSIVYRPMDLQTIRKNIESGVIRTTVEFKRDVMLMFTNALMYNKRQGQVYEMARQMQAEAMQQIQILQAAQTQLEAPARRETRTSESGLKRKRQDDLLTKNKKRRDE